MSALLVHPLTGAPASRCTNPIEHRPRPLRFVWHHVQPESAGGTASSLVEVCDNCQPPGTMVRVAGAGHQRECRPGYQRPSGEVPIEQLKVGDKVVSYQRAYGTFRMRGSAITSIGSRPYHGDLVVAKAGGTMSRYTTEHRCVVRISDAFDGKFLVYLMVRNGQYRIGRCKGSYRLKQSGEVVFRLGATTRAVHEGADAFWILRVCDTVDEAAYQEATLSWQFGLPQMTFVGGRWADAPLSQVTVDRFWASVGDNREQAASVLSSVGKDMAYPIWTRGSGRKFGSTVAVIEACNLEDGMRMIPFRDTPGTGRRKAAVADCLPITVQRERYHGPVYSMDVADDHTYVADDLVTHNCHYGTHAILYYMRLHNGALPVGGSEYQRDIAAVGYGMCVKARTVDEIPNEGGSV